MQFLDILNDYRTDNGLQPLTLDLELTAAADWMSYDLASRSTFSHIDSLGRDPGQRARDFGYYGGVGENIAGGWPFGSAQTVFEAWKSSPGHNKNMLGSSYRVIGIGLAYDPTSPYLYYWTTDFGLTADEPGDTTPFSCGVSPTPTPGSPTPTPTPVPTASPLPSTPKPGSATPSPQVTPTATPLPPSPTPTPTEPPPPTPEPVVLGDVDCDSAISSVDALMILRLVALIDSPSECQKATADVDCDGQITAVDALRILLYIVSAPQQPPGGCPPIGAAA